MKIPLYRSSQHSADDQASPIRSHRLQSLEASLTWDFRNGVF